MSSEILISVGSNIDKVKNTQSGVNALALTFDNIACSSVYESESVGFNGDNFYNLVVKANTSQTIEEVCRSLKKIEDDHGRKRAVKFSSRTLDLDLLTYNDEVCERPVVLPRDEIEYNAFVLQPMAELVPELRHPVTGDTYADLWASFSKSSASKQQKLWPITFTWSKTPK